MKPMQLPLLDREECPNGVEVELWGLFVKEADRVRNSGRTRYSARTILEFIRHHQTMSDHRREFKINNNHQQACSIAFMKMRNCWSFFEIRQRHNYEVDA